MKRLSGRNRILYSAMAGLLMSWGCAKPQQAAAPAPAPAEPQVTEDAMEKHACKGMNACKGKGGCAVEGKHACKGKNECKGAGGCKTA